MDATHVGGKELLANMDAINCSGGSNYSGNLVIKGYIGAAIRPGQSIVDHYGNMKNAMVGFGKGRPGRQWLHDTLTRTIC